jgi:hypothetical protein
MNPRPRMNRKMRDEELSSPALEERLSGDLEELSAFARELAQISGSREDALPGARGRALLPGRINADPESVEQGLAKLVLSLIELLRRLMEKQALRRIEAGSLSDEQIERMGETFMKLDEKMIELKAVFGLENEDLNLDLGPLGRLLPDD